MSQNDVRRVVRAVERAAGAGLSYERLRKAVGEATTETAGAARAWYDVATSPETALKRLRTELTNSVVRSESRIKLPLESLERQVEDRARHSIDLVTDERTGVVRAWWRTDAEAAASAERSSSSASHQTEGDKPDSGRIVLVRVDGAQVGERNVQVNVFVHEIDPEINFAEVMKDSPVSQALEQVARHPGDDGIRQAAVARLSREWPHSTGDWTNAAFSAPKATFGPGLHALDGTLSLVRCRSVQVGNRLFQENRIVHTVSPTIKGISVLAGNPKLANSLIDVACLPGDRTAKVAFHDALRATLESRLASSPVVQRGHGTVYRPPGAGRTLRVTNTYGVSVGRRVSQKNRHVQIAQFGGHFRTSARRAVADVERTAK